MSRNCKKFIVYEKWLPTTYLLSVSTASVFSTVGAGSSSAGPSVAGTGTSSTLFLVGRAGNASSNRAETSPNEKDPNDPNSIFSSVEAGEVI